jgi:hypothetical protein
MHDWHLFSLPKNGWVLESCKRERELANDVRRPHIATPPAMITNDASAP